MENILEIISEKLIKGEGEEVEKLTKEALNRGIAPKDILTDSLLKGMTKAGEMFKEKTLTMYDVLEAAKTMEKSVKILKPLLKDGDMIKKGKILTGSVQGDFHDIGKNLCILMLESNGFQVIDMGVDVPQEKIEEDIKKYSPDILMLSAMIAPTMEVMKMTVKYLRDKGVIENLKIMVGGAPLTEEIAASMGAYYSADAVSAVEVARKLLNI
ncbi:cobalamin B12-binding domain-containing protein [Fusobacterium varium]|uniref:Methylmalonyl-CoA mutase n=1 Tax=Fusobacterium varium ATCC 27725 TaxID=469618 RepID=A0ABM6U6P9_FUSVA|nr:cobalamin-dependent protein [Fusobacterium varium]AVQ32080.1 methylmalonyl-CoA mutase [Fusobacterium varium ATCC 27725]EES63446.1 B12 binding domain protein [Fusobacterium varium ATCC 27725]VEH39033.1 Methionine synthase [Fusobacterium varium]